MRLADRFDFALEVLDLDIQLRRDFLIRLNLGDQIAGELFEPLQLEGDRDGVSDALADRVLSGADEAPNSACSDCRNQ